MATSSCKFIFKNLKAWMKPQKEGAGNTTFPSSASIVPKPFGVMLIVSAWNYPFLLPIDPVIAGIAAGNIVVLKPSEISPATSLFAKPLLNYVDDSCIKVVEGAVPETTALFRTEVGKILYTGYSKVARIVMTVAAKHLTPVIMELGGKYTVVVDLNVDLKVATKRTTVGKWGCNNGQACIALNYIMITKSFAPKLLKSMKITLEKFYGSNPLESPDLSWIVNSNHFSRLAQLLDGDKSIRQDCTWRWP